MENRSQENSARVPSLLSQSMPTDDLKKKHESGVWSVFLVAKPDKRGNRH